MSSIGLSAAFFFLSSLLSLLLLVVLLSLPVPTLLLELFLDSSSAFAAASASAAAASAAAASSASFLACSSSASLFAFSSFSLAALVFAVVGFLVPKLPHMLLTAFAADSSSASSFLALALSPLGLALSTFSSWRSLDFPLVSPDLLVLLVLVVVRERVPFLVLVFVLAEVRPPHSKSSRSGISVGPGSGVKPCAGGVGAGG